MTMIRHVVRSSRRSALGLGMGLGLTWGWLSVVGTMGAPSAPQVASKPEVSQKAAAKLKPNPTTPAPAATSSPDGRSKPSTARVEKGLFKLEVVLTGVFEAKRMAEVAIRPKTWTMPLVVDRAIEVGTPVRKGDILVEFDREKIDKALQDAEVEDTLADLTLKQAQEELPSLEKSLPVDLAAAERSRTYADEDLKYFLEVDRPMSERMAHFMVKENVEWLEYSKEELRQLEKMYRSKDLTEETEEIILRRQRFQVEMYEFFLKESELRRDQTLKLELPRREQRTRENLIKQTIDLERARAILPLNVNQKRLNLAKLKHDRAKAAEKLVELRQDREAMTVHAPADGLVYYGHPERGQWPSAAAAAQKLHKWGIISPDEVFLTVVAPRPLDIRATVEEKDLAGLIQPGELRGRVTPTFDPDLNLPARLTSVLPIPRESGKFECIVTVELDDHTPIKPGMACSVKFVPYRKDDALTVPSSGVFEDDATDGTPVHYVYLAKTEKDGKYPKRPVKTGKTTGGKTEIRDGLAEGDEILTSKP
jgi:multidrug efflux pump subunit AcrA (membrane-fusion protein)